MNTSLSSSRVKCLAADFSRSLSVRRIVRRRRGLSVVLIGVAIVALIGFVSLAVDIGRVKLAKAQLQTAADAAALAGATGLKELPTGVGETQERAYEAAYKNFNIDTKDGSGQREDHEVELVVDEDIEFGIWRDSTRTFERLTEDNGGIDERRKANAVRAWGRRVTSYIDPETGETFERGTGLPLIFAPVLPNGPLNGQIQANATARLMGGRSGFGFIGIDSVKFNGTTATDSYDADTEAYPGADGLPNANSSISSNGDIRLVGTTDILGDVHPGVNNNIVPIPLGGNVTVTGEMNPLSEPLQAGVHYTVPTYSAPSTNNNSSGVTPPNAVKPNGAFQAANNTTIKYTSAGGNFVFTSWSSGSHDKVTFDNTDGPISVWVNGNFTNGAQAEIHLKTNNWPVTLWINGNFDMQGGGLINDVPTGALPKNFIVNVTKANTRVDIGGSPNVYMHLNAPLSDVKLHGHGTSNTLGFYGWAVGKSLEVLGNMKAHYDESMDAVVRPYEIKMVD